SLRRLVESTPQDLIPASGDRDHAALLVRERIARLAMLPRPSHPVPTFVAIGQTPLQGEAGRAGSKHLFLKTGRWIISYLAKYLPGHVGQISDPRFPVGWVERSETHRVTRRQG